MKRNAKSDISRAVVVGVLLCSGSVCVKGDQALLDELATPVGETPAGHFESPLIEDEAETMVSMENYVLPQYGPPKGARYVLMPGGEGAGRIADKAVLRYDLSGPPPLVGTVSLSQTKHVFAIELIRSGKGEGVLSRADVQKCIEMLLGTVSGQAKFRFLGAEDVSDCGLIWVTIPEGAQDLYYPRSIRWWQDGRRFGFAFLKMNYRKDAASTLTEEAWDLKYNQGWFRHDISPSNRPKFFNNHRAEGADVFHP